MKKEMCTESVSPNKSRTFLRGKPTQKCNIGKTHSQITSKGNFKKLRDKKRMLKYKMFAVAFSYPDDRFFALFPRLFSQKEELVLEYDRLFRAHEIWLYGEEYIAKNEFQRAHNLADIMGFYHAFGLEPDKDRPDCLASELEFMHYLIFKRLQATKDRDTPDAAEKAAICLDAQKKFFIEHLYPAAKKFAKAIISRAENNFYSEIARKMLKFLESEEKLLPGLHK